MQLYILRHAVAVPRGTVGYPNDDRPLTEDGISKMTEGAKAINKIAGSFDVIISSPLIRALHTAKILAEHTGYKREISVTGYLLPGNPQRSLFKYLSEYNALEKVCIVGHEPHLGFVASKLVGIDNSVIEFKKGGICCLDIEKFPPKNPGKIIWLFQPKHLKLIKEEKISD
ncbi:MAG TPA: phosphohistidine phosphatase SixA, partial [Ignavibacteria bacterium]